VQFFGVGIVEGDFLGWQDNAVNYVEGNVTGLQVGLFNYGDHVEGLQVGVVNYAGSMSGLQLGLANNSQVAEVRHLGLLVAVEMKQPCSKLVGHALEQGLLINVTAANVVRLLPPLILSEAQTSELATRLIDCINTFTG